jgi:hypothetical protein
MARGGNDRGPSRFKGVSRHIKNNKWQVFINIHGKQTTLGYFNDEEEAALKYDKAAILLGRPLNFPGVGRVRAVKGGCGGSSRFKGVSWYSRVNKWRALIAVHGKNTHLGYFIDEEEAARTYDEAAAPLGRPLNFSGDKIDEVEVIDGKIHRARSKIHYFTPEFNRVLNSFTEKKITTIRVSKFERQCKNKKWVVQVRVDGKVTYLSMFDEKEEASQAYDEVSALAFS